ncbi:xanthine dehydrogenase accessory protein XdhC [Marinobacter nanhaiticus D15-8W]|uniref:Xanthine dehydrogenase accessory protein XdhC n=1 Tax=Marinobacter nanhaiticus D15-8W TaxID=626887 RepID=N6X1A2_9GAMM|nr:xanthine dehydrogenase accessory protein XdhC [Marinobacter nanhaiticus]ENO14868.1 xanthine dehydrogenase accessory protein XdhC [Marinobacter nanhaiticus D15-8W]BES69438.1 xanthine dehydrogenase accessory protein XdhC [Marinobacter nanhaiticus D15-8W]
MQKRMTWYEAVADCEKRGEPYVLVTVLGVTGSVPREPASKMVVTGEHSHDTIGGGHLEYRIIARARERLAARDYTYEMCHFPLGASLGQCCGGSVAVLMEGHAGGDGRLVVFGAGHVAKSLITIMGELPWQITWVDSRAESFPAELPANVKRHHTDDPVGDAAALCEDAHVVILTHNHQLDFDLCRVLLEAGRAASIGLIGSDTKAERFRQRLAHRGFTDEAITQIRCPVGRSDVPGKRPMEVAVSISAELLSIASPSTDKPMRRGLSWSNLKNLMIETPATAPAASKTED